MFSSSFYLKYCKSSRLKRCRQFGQNTMLNNLDFSDYILFCISRMMSSQMQISINILMDFASLNKECPADVD